MKDIFFLFLVLMFFVATFTDKGLRFAVNGTEYRFKIGEAGK